VTDEPHKRYTRQARTGIKGEAFFEALVADYAIPHHIVGPKDIGIDYVCEWVHGDSPTGVLFAAQVKAFAVTPVTEPRHAGVETKLNELEKYTISNSNLTVDARTLCYWKGFGLPVYLFVVTHTAAAGQKHDRLDLYYKRFTPVLTKDEKQEDLCYYKVSAGSKFIAFARESEKRQGFARDLFIDLMRWSYYKGSISYLNPRKLGLQQFPEEEMVFHDLFREYSERVCETYSKTKKFLEEHCGQPSVEVGRTNG
jgi:Domain of unknown function (DUF4365)